jgi:RimJ/RimL family protein N-acetyltransferase
MSTVIETPRLLLRPFVVDDAEAAFGWLSDAAVMKYSPKGPDATIERTTARIATYRAHQAAYGYSKWVILERDTGLAVGDAGLMVLDDEGWIDLGFRFSPVHWGRGFATEVAQAWIHVAFDEHEIGAIGAFAHADNIASLRVLDKLGFTPLRDDIVMGMPARVYRMTASQHTRAALRSH